jgi:hypothetical protein
MLGSGPSIAFEPAAEARFDLFLRLRRVARTKRRTLYAKADADESEELSRAILRRRAPSDLQIVAL